MTAPVRVETATERDLGALLAIDVWLVEPDRQAAIVRASVAGRECLVARDGAHPAGYLTWDLGFFQRPFVRLLVVAPTHRRRGIGTLLIAATERAVRARSLGELFVSTEAINVPMQALLARAAYAPSGSVDNVNAPGNAELIYHKHLR